MRIAFDLVDRNDVGFMDPDETIVRQFFLNGLKPGSGQDIFALFTKNLGIVFHRLYVEDLVGRDDDLSIFSHDCETGGLFGVLGLYTSQGFIDRFFEAFVCEWFMQEINGVKVESFQGVLGVGGGENETALVREGLGNGNTIETVHLDVEEY